MHPITIARGPNSIAFAVGSLSQVPQRHPDGHWEFHCSRIIADGKLYFSENLRIIDAPNERRWHDCYLVAFATETHASDDSRLTRTYMYENVVFHTYGEPVFHEVQPPRREPVLVEGRIELFFSKLAARLKGMFPWRS